MFYIYNSNNNNNICNLFLESEKINLQNMVFNRSKYIDRNKFRKGYCDWFFRCRSLRFDGWISHGIRMVSHYRFYRKMQRTN